MCNNISNFFKEGFIDNKKDKCSFIETFES